MSLNRFKVGDSELLELVPATLSSDVGVITLTPEAFATLRNKICGRKDCISDAELIRFRCPNIEETVLPDISFNLGGRDFPLSHQFYI